MMLSIAPDGTCQCLHSDLIPLQELGRLTVRRASTVEFNGYTQEWEVWPEPERTLSVKPLFKSPSRAECLAWEEANFQSLV